MKSSLGKWRSVLSAITTVVAVAFSVSTATAEVITPVGVLGTSEFGVVDVFGDGSIISDVFVTDLIDGGGLSDTPNTPDNVLDDLHDNDWGSLNAWHTGDFDAGLPGGTDDDGDPFTAPVVEEQALEFDLGGLFSVEKAHIWQQNQGPFFGPPEAPNRGLQEFRILTSTSSEGDDFASLGTFSLLDETGFDPVPAQVLSLGDEPATARRVRFEFVSAYSGMPNEFVGLSEVRFEGTSLAIEGDFNDNGMLDTGDIDDLTQQSAGGENPLDPYDLTDDGVVNSDDVTYWVHELANTWIGDADLNGLFDSNDVISVLAENTYEMEDKPAVWTSGDFNGSGRFTAQDVIDALADDGYENGPRTPVAVPEPTALVIALLGFMALPWRSRGRQ